MSIITWSARVSWCPREKVDEKFEYSIIVFEGSDKKIGCQNNSKKILQWQKQKQMSQNLKQKTDRSVSDKWCHPFLMNVRNEKWRNQPCPYHPLIPASNMQKTVHLYWLKLTFSEKDMGNCLCYDISDEANRWEQKRDLQRRKVEECRLWHSRN